jgi:cytochrome P450
MRRKIMVDGKLHGSFSLEKAPMARDRSDGWAYFRSFGPVFEVDEVWYLTSAAAVQYAQQHPELFSSARAFDALGSPLPLVPIAMDPPEHVRYRRVLDPMLAPRVINMM